MFARALKLDLCVYALSLVVIIVRSSSDEWAARALGVGPGDEAPGEGATAGSGGLVRYRYDWERDEWRAD